MASQYMYNNCEIMCKIDEVADEIKRMEAELNEIKKTMQKILEVLER